jgi:hypothetical protein
VFVDSQEYNQDENYFLTGDGVSMLFKCNLRLVATLIFIAALFEYIPHAGASVDVYLGLNVGSVLMKEENTGTEYNHQSSFFVGHWGYSLGVRPKLDLGKFSLGVVGEVGWVGNSMERKLTTATDKTNYRNEFRRGLAGPTVALNTGASSIIFEYYPWVQNSVFYSDNKTENPFRKDDTLKATGYGFGFNFGFSNGFASQILYKNLVYKEVMMNGLKAVLPNDQFKLLKVDEVTLGFVLKF